MNNVLRRMSFALMAILYISKANALNPTSCPINDLECQIWEEIEAAMQCPIGDAECIIRKEKWERFSEEYLSNVDVSFSYSTSGASGVKKYVCSNEFCVKTLDLNERERFVFHVDEPILFDLAKHGWASTYNGSYIRAPYTIGWAYYGTYLDESCHSKLNFQTNQNAVLWWWSSYQNCDSVGVKLYDGAENPTTYRGSHVYKSPGLYWVGAYPMPYVWLGVSINTNLLVRPIMVVDESVYIPGVDEYKWLVPVMALLL